MAIFIEKHQGFICVDVMRMVEMLIHHGCQLLSLILSL